MKRFLTLLLATVLLLTLCSCKQNDTDGNQDTRQSDTSSEVTSDTSAPQVTTTPNESEQITSRDELTAEQEKTTDSPKEDGSDDEDNEEIIDDEINSKALETLGLLNSDKVHAKFVEMISYDGEYIAASDREFFVSDGYAVFLSDSSKIIIDGTSVTVIDLDEMTYYTYPYNEKEFSNNFGYDIGSYQLTDSAEEGGTLTETFKIEQYGNEIVSTWVFSPSGDFTVKDVNADAGSFSYYSFEILNDDCSGMDITIPDGLTQISE